MTEMQQLERQVASVDAKVSSILQLLKGNELDEEDLGMIGIQNDHEKRIDRIEKLFDRMFWFLIGLSAFAGWGIVDIIQKVVLKK
jgi:hypothetical protein